MLYVPCLLAFHWSCFHVLREFEQVMFSGSSQMHRPTGGLSEHSEFWALEMGSHLGPPLLNIKINREISSGLGLSEGSAYLKCGDDEDKKGDDAEKVRG